ncbi:MAG: ribosome-associated translation inhibitor RaiA [Chloroflexi bacterium]|nr:ribosome-associated translation inhibitor RaiA [Chloroflexota bacterium]
MDVIVSGKNLPLTEAIKSYAYEKLGRLARYWPAIWRVEVTCSVEPAREVEARHLVEASVVVGGMLFHAQERAGDLYVAIDSLVEKLERQLRRKKGQLSDRRGAPIWPEPTGAELATPLTLLRAEDVQGEKDAPGGFGDLPNLLGWPVAGPQGKQVGTITGLYVHPDRGEIAYLVVGTRAREFVVPLAEADVRTDQELVQLRRNLRQLPRRPAEVRGVETPLRRFLENYDVPEPVIERLEAYGVRTMDDLRIRLEEGRLPALLGERHREDLAEIERLVDEQGQLFA